MTPRRIGSTDLAVHPIGLGCMGLSEFYGPATEQSEAVALLHRAIELGVTHFDTAEIYGSGANETLLGAALADRRDGLVIATKFGINRSNDPNARVLNGSRENVRRAVEGSLQRLRIDTIDIYYLHRVDPATPIEDTVAAMAELVREGKVRALGLSEVSGDTLRRAHAVHPIAAVQSEYSIFSRDIEDTVLPAARELGVSVVAYSPLGRGMLAGRFTREDRPDANDFRTEAHSPRFAPGAYEANLALVEEVHAVAGALNATAGQVALAWVLGRGAEILTIPGTTKRANLESNMGAADVALPADAQERLDRLADQVQGARYNAMGMSTINA